MCEIFALCSQVTNENIFKCKAWNIFISENGKRKGAKFQFKRQYINLQQLKCWKIKHQTILIRDHRDEFEFSIHFKTYIYAKFTKESESSKRPGQKFNVI